MDNESEIERKRRERREKREREAAAGVAEAPNKCRFIVRPMLEVQTPGEGPGVTVLTYNMLAQALIRRKLFPTSGPAVKWPARLAVLLAELTHYNADVLLLQEVDTIQYASFWKGELLRLGYRTRMHHYGDKNHGVCICWKQEVFLEVGHRTVEYDRLATAGVQPSISTTNIGLLVALLLKTPGAHHSGVLLATSHLFWHPFGTYDRTRQTYLLQKSVRDYGAELGPRYLQIMGGDFNSQPFDSPYLSVCEKPVGYTGRARRVLECSADHDFADKDKTEPVPDLFEPSPEVVAKVEALERLHNSLPARAISLYSVGYGSVHPANAGRDNSRNEPFFSNWAHTWRGLLDYICVVVPWPGDDRRAVDTLQQLQQQHQVRLTHLLRMPEPEEMPEHDGQPLGQPQAGQYPSDHLCMMARIELV